MTSIRNWVIGLLSVLTIFFGISLFFPDNVVSQGAGVRAYIEQRRPTVFSTTHVTTNTTPIQIYDYNVLDRRVLIQEIGILPVSVAEDSASAQDDYMFVLSAGTTARDGLGGVWQDGVYNDSILGGNDLWGYSTAADSVAVTIWR